MLSHANTMTPLAILLIFFCSFILRKILGKHGRKLPPGPWPLPIIGNLDMLTCLPHRGLQRLAQKYGPIMSLRLGHIQTIVVSTPQAAKLFLKTHDAIFASRPKIQASEYLSYGAKGMVLTKYGPYWRSVRKFCTQKFLTASKTKMFAAALRREELGSLVDSLKKAAVEHKVVNVTRMVDGLIEDMTFRMILGIRKKDNGCDMKGLLEEALSLAGAFNIADFVPFLGPLDLQGFTRRLKKVRKSIDNLLENIIVEYEQATTKREGHRTDFLDVLLSLMNQPINSRDECVEGIDRTGAKALLLDMIAGAMDTSSSTIDWTLSEILKNPRVMRNLQEELESVCGMDRVVEEKDLGKLVYLDMVVKESFRLHPAGPLLVPHESMEDAIVEGYHIPKNSRILVNVWAIGRDPNVWSENVEEFYPERFIDNKIDVQGHDFRLLPFGSGRRVCPGMQLGLTNVQFVVAQLLHCFNWELPSEIEAKDVDMTEKFGLAVKRANQLLAKPTYRLVS